jgi:hypothetical protein
MATIEQKVRWHSIGLCPQGHVMLQFGPTTVHLTREDWRDFLNQVHAFVQNWEKSLESFEVKDLAFQFSTH